MSDKETPSIPDVKSKTVEFEKIVKHYLDSNPVMTIGNKTSELEIRFGTNPRVSKPITKIDYDNVVKQLYDCGFVSDNIKGVQMLRVQNEYTDTRTGQKRMSNIRAEINGTDMIQEYCSTNSIQRLIDMPSTTLNKLNFTQKNSALAANGEYIRRMDMEDYNFRVSFQTEQIFHMRTSVANNIISKWNDSLKIFRCMNRVRFRHPSMPVFVDMSVVKMSKKVKYVPVPKYTIQESGVFQGNEQYEIELEVDNSRVGDGTEYNNVKSLMNMLRKSIRIIMSGIQGTKYPITYSMKNDILYNYMKLVHGEKYEPKSRILPRDFTGPSSFTLQLENIIEQDEDNKQPNIRNDYTVTDKADGERKLLYIASDGKIYMIDTNMNVIFTGSKTNEKTIFDSLIDGEHIKYDKNGNYIQLYAAFDVYYIHTKNTREFPFVPTNDDETETKCRLPLLHKLVELIKPRSIMDPTTKERTDGKSNTPCDLRIQVKTFYNSTPETSIFDGCSRILSNVRDGAYEYTTDGLIFTPSRLAVGGNEVGDKGGNITKITWEHSFKWKPPEFNTIDFLVSIKKDEAGKDEVHHIFQDGINTTSTSELLQYKTLILRCGFDERKHGFINPYQDILDDNIQDFSDMDKEDGYKPVPFQPTKPYDKNAAFCNVLLKDDGTKTYMETEEGEYFDEDTIVEFKYVETNDDKWRWVPLRVRYDKTSELRAGLKNFGNAYHVANSNWHSIHNPVTEEMITSGEGIPQYMNNEDVYYNRTDDETSTRSLRDFHNIYVKSKLIQSVSRRGNTLVDLAAGKAGDLSKWIRAKLSFVLGIDISKDNIHNQLDGACARYLKSRKKQTNIPSALFLHGDSSLNIRNGTAYYTEKDKQVSNAIFGKGPKDPLQIGKGVYNSYGVAEQGFNVTSCQFAMHYFFENETTLHQFMRNVCECTRLNGYFIGTCYDGNEVFQMLNNKKNGESVTIFKEQRKIYELTRLYDQTGFPDDETSVGYPINVYQESINKTFREYLVNFRYLERIMEDYGFVLLTRDESQQMGINKSTGLFSELFQMMEQEVAISSNKHPEYKKAMLMSPEEKQISYLNRYFIFKKVRSVDARKMAEAIRGQTKIVEQTEPQEEPEEPEEPTETTEPQEQTIVKIRVPKRTNRKLVIKKPKSSN